jgi:hypothetical protein
MQTPVRPTLAQLRTASPQRLCLFFQLLHFLGTRLQLLIPCSQLSRKIGSLVLACVEFLGTSAQLVAERVGFRGAFAQFLVANA